MQRVGYPGYLEHRKIHLAFAAEIGKLKERLKTEGPTKSLVATIRMFIIGWLIDHICKLDGAIGRFVTAAGNAGDALIPTPPVP